MMIPTLQQIKKRKALVALLRSAEKVDSDYIWPDNNFAWLFRTVYTKVSEGSCGCAIGLAFHFSLIFDRFLDIIAMELGFEEDEAQRIFLIARTYINEHNDDGRTSVFDQITPEMVADELEKTYVND